MNSPNPKFKIGDIVRYDNGNTALMQITTISSNHGSIGSHRYYGIQYYGRVLGRYEDQLSPATDTEIKKFKTDDHTGRLRDVERALEFYK